MPFPSHQQRGWFKSKYSNGSCACVLVSFQLETAKIRDSKFERDYPEVDPETQPTLEVAIGQWIHFVAEVVSGVSDFRNGALTVEDAGDNMKRLRSVSTGEALLYTEQEWTAFTAGAHAGEFHPVLAHS